MNLPSNAAAHSPLHQQLMNLTATHRFITTWQLARFTQANYGSLRSAARQMLRHMRTLEQRGWVLSLQRQIGGWQGGSSVTVWALSTAGYRQLTGSGKRQRPGAISTTYLAHILAKTEVSVVAHETVATMPSAKVAIQHEPDCWRTFLAPSGQTVTLRPDQHLSIRTPEFVDSYFVEVDLATENPARVVRTMRRYQRYQQQCANTNPHDVFPLVVWITPNTTRREQLGRYLAVEPGLPGRLWVAITLEQLPSIIRDGPPKPT